MYGNNILKSRFFKHGVPFALLVIGSSFAFRNFTTLRYDFSRNEKISPEEKAEIDKLFKKPHEYNIDTEYEKYKQLDITNWTNKRIPRPWEEEEQQQSSS